MQSYFLRTGTGGTDWLPERNKATVKREADLGMEIGTHTYSHADLRKLSADEVAEELSKGAPGYTDITGGEVTLMRPPYGENFRKHTEQHPLPDDPLGRRHSGLAVQGSPEHLRYHDGSDPGRFDCSDA